MRGIVVRKESLTKPPSINVPHYRLITVLPSSPLLPLLISSTSPRANALSLLIMQPTSTEAMTRSREEQEEDEGGLVETSPVRVSEEAYNLLDTRTYPSV